MATKKSSKPVKKTAKKVPKKAAAKRVPKKVSAKDVAKKVVRKASPKKTATAPVEVAEPQVAQTPPTQPMLECTVENGAQVSPQKLTELKEKTMRRATRHFAGKEVKHRVIEESPNSITFGFFRRSGKPVRIRWQMISA